MTDDVEVVIDTILRKVGKDIRFGAPLGIGKPIQILNALYRRAESDPTIQLTIFTALTLSRPKAKSFLEKRFLDPFLERVFGSGPELLYEIHRNRLPTNIRVVEFYFPAGKYLRNPKAQQDYISTNYTHVWRDLLIHGVNVIGQAVAQSLDRSRVSLSCNPDVTLDLMDALRRTNPYPYIFVGEVNDQLPFMYGDADRPASDFHLYLKNTQTTAKLFGPPKSQVGLVDTIIGLYASTLVKDGGELQIGIGSLGDAIIQALLLRHRDNAVYRNVIGKLNLPEDRQDWIETIGGLTRFEDGLFATSEMFVDGFMHLMKAGILKRRVYDHLILQRLLNEGLITETVNSTMVHRLLERHAIHPRVTQSDFDFLVHFGIFRSDLVFRSGMIEFSDGTKVLADFNDDQSHETLMSKALGQTLTNGAVLHGGFFLGCQAFYDWLRGLSEEERRLIHMKSVQKINQLYGHEDLDRLHRRHARFFNTCMMMTVTGSAVSDGLDDGRVVSGVGGQYNFVAMAHELPGGCSILQLRSTRSENGRTKSNIVFNYGHVTIPRHLKDIVITEYGVADLRGKTDAEVIRELIQIADSRFQESLIRQCKQVGKLPHNFMLRESFRQNTPETLRDRMKNHEQHFPAFPFGADFTNEELVLAKALRYLKGLHGWKKIQVVVSALLSNPAKSGVGEPEIQVYLRRMDLNQRRSIKEWFWSRLLHLGLRTVLPDKSLARKANDG